jgi:hypothetical protein
MSDVVYREHTTDTSGEMTPEGAWLFGDWREKICARPSPR